jgi:energy-coupling factor transporter ATP-binding protein EcfA2
MSCHVTGADGVWTSKQDVVQAFGLRKVYRMPPVRSQRWWSPLRVLVRPADCGRQRELAARAAAQKRPQQFVAVADSWFGVPKGQLLCLLGPNGAGKTTSINCLVGATPCAAAIASIHTCTTAFVAAAAAHITAAAAAAYAAAAACTAAAAHITAAAAAAYAAAAACTAAAVMRTGALPPSGGDIRVMGHSLLAAGGLEVAQAVMGVCPQFDVLWDELSGREHMYIYGCIKGLGSREARARARGWCSGNCTDGYAALCQALPGGGSSSSGSTRKRKKRQGLCKPKPKPSTPSTSLHCCMHVLFLCKAAGISLAP